MKAVVFGHICIDKNVSEGKSYTAAGGPAVFITKVLSKFGCPTTTVAPYGNDFLPYAKNLILYPKESANDNTLRYENVSRNNLRTQKALYRPAHFNIEITEALAAQIRQSDIIFVAPLLPNINPEYIKRINKRAKKEALLVLLAQGYFRDFDSQNNVLIRDFLEADDVLPFFNIVAVSERDHPQMKQLAKKWVRSNGNAAIVITLAERGALIVSSRGEKHIPTIPVPLDKIIDSVGCGDIFSAGLAYYYKKSRVLEEAVIAANKLARQHLLCQRSRV